MLTDKEIQAMCNDCIRNRKTTNDFARVIERAVLAKAGEQEPICMWRLEDDGLMECTKIPDCQLDYMRDMLLSASPKP